MERERVEKHKKKMIDDEKKVERAAQVRLPLPPYILRRAVRFGGWSH